MSFLSYKSIGHWADYLGLGRTTGDLTPVCVLLCKMRGTAATCLEGKLWGWTGWAWAWHVLININKNGHKKNELKMLHLQLSCPAQLLPLSWGPGAWQVLSTYTGLREMVKPTSGLGRGTTARLQPQNLFFRHTEHLHHILFGFEREKGSV